MSVIAITPDGKTAYVASDGSRHGHPDPDRHQHGPAADQDRQRPRRHRDHPGRKNRVRRLHRFGQRSPRSISPPAPPCQPIRTGSLPDAIAITPDGKTAYVVSQLGHGDPHPDRHQHRPATDRDRPQPGCHRHHPGREDRLRDQPPLGHSDPHPDRHRHRPATDQDRPQPGRHRHHPVAAPCPAAVKIMGVGREEGPDRHDRGRDRPAGELGGVVSTFWCAVSGRMAGLHRPSVSDALSRSLARAHRGMPPVPTWRVRLRSRSSWEKSFSRGCQDQAKAHGQDPRALLPDHRRRRPHQAGRPGDRRDRQVSPQGRSVPHRGRLRARPVLAVGGSTADRPGAQDSRGDRRLAEVQGPARRRGHPEDGRAEAGQEGSVRRGGGRDRQGSQGQGRRRQGRRCQAGDGKAAEAKADKGRSRQAGRFGRQARCRQGRRW